jgi:hypothetical protein
MATSGRAAHSELHTQVLRNHLAALSGCSAHTLLLLLGTITRSSRSALGWETLASFPPAPGLAFWHPAFLHERMELTDQGDGRVLVKG